MLPLFGSRLTVTPSVMVNTPSLAAVISAVPATTNLLVGAVLPIPTLPLLSMRIASTPPSLKAIVSAAGDHIPVLRSPVNVWLGAAAVPREAERTPVTAVVAADIVSVPCPCVPVPPVPAIRTSKSTVVAPELKSIKGDEEVLSTLPSDREPPESVPITTLPDPVDAEMLPSVVRLPLNVVLPAASVPPIDSL